jgi:hypothetical protein
MPINVLSNSSSSFFSWDSLERNSTWYANLRNLSKSMLLFFFFLVFAFRIQRAFACNLFHLVKHLANDFSGFLINIIGIYNVVNMYKLN